MSLVVIGIAVVLAATVIALFMGAHDGSQDYTDNDRSDNYDNERGI